MQIYVTFAARISQPFFKGDGGMLQDVLHGMAGGAESRCHEGVMGRVAVGGAMSGHCFFLERPAKMLQAQCRPSRQAGRAAALAPL
jgi:hypothetical protein